jgi:eukaryotic-like serine/threonine-protein kinase
MASQPPPPNPMALSGTWRIPGEEPASATNLPITWGKYTLVKRMAKGGMAELFLAIQRSMAGFEKLVVIKRILPEMHEDKSFIEMLLSEARVAATLSHPNIVQTFDAGEVNGTPFIAMEHVNGEDIRGVVRQMKKVGKQEFPLGLALEIVMSVAAGLAYAHERVDLDGTKLHIVHRDISPQNVVLTFDGDVKIVDFGIAKSDTKFGTHTKSGRLKGKIPYMSPEQARGEEVDGRSDIFSLGIMLFELTTGRRLFKGPSEYETLRLICEERYPLPTELRADYPIALENVVMKALAKDRKDRYATARDMQRDLEAYARAERIDTGSVALSEFMREVFADELANQAADKDLIARVRQQSTPDDSGESQRQPALSTPAAARTVTEVRSISVQKRGRRRMLAAAALALVGAGAIGGGYAVKRNGTQAAGPGESSVKRTVTVEIKSDQPGATVWVNGALKGQTPIVVDSIANGSPLEIKVTKDGYESAIRRIAPTEDTSLVLALEKGAAHLELDIQPKGAEVLLDGTLLTSSEALKLTPGEHQLLVRAPGYDDVQETLHAVSFETLKRHVVLPKSTRVPGKLGALPAALPGKASAPTAAAGSGRLNVATSSGWCTLAVDGAPKGPTPIAGLVLPAGQHQLTCTTEGGKTHATSVNVKADETTRFRFTL